MIKRFVRNAGIVGTALAGGIAAGQATAITLSLVDAADINSSDISVAAGDTFSIFVRATDMPVTYSGAVDVDWTDGILQLNSWSVFTPFDEISLGAPVTTSNSISNLNGGVFLGTPVSGAFNFAQLNFTALTPGGTPLNLTAIESVFGWTDDTGNPITFDNVFGATVTVSAVVPLPAAFWLLGSGLLGMLMVARTRRQ